MKLPNVYLWRIGKPGQRINTMATITREQATKATDEALAELIAEVEARTDIGPRERQALIDHYLDSREFSIERLISEKNLVKLISSTKPAK
jgi:hypothetical protein